MKVLLGSLAVLIVVAVVAACGGGRGGYATPAYRVVERGDGLEVRDYPPLVLVGVSASGKKGDDGAFMRLFRYISGRNENGTKIAMTTPVLMQAGSGGGDRAMAFVMPSEMGVEKVPKPSDEALRPSVRQAGRYVVFRDSGWWKKRDEERAAARVKDWVERRGLKVQGEPEVAYYDPPWTLGPLRRNELLWRIGPTATVNATDAGK
jgi:hypothetical protein